MGALFVYGFLNGNLVYGFVKYFGWNLYLFDLLFDLFGEEVIENIGVLV